MTAQNQPMTASQSLLLIVDIQQRLAPAIHGIDAVMARNEALLQAAAQLNVPAVITEQYPSGLGHTNPGLLAMAPGATVYEKIHFGAAAEPGFNDLVRALDRPEIIITGTEAHVCVLQTALGLAAQGYRIRFCVDAIGSRTDTDKSIALERARAAGFTLVTTEMVLFEWLGRADSDDFRALLPTIRDLAALDAG